jgi:hypothetical protein
MRKAMAVLVMVGGLTLASASGIDTSQAPAQAVGKHCRPVKAGGYRATHIYADFMPCQSARSKLRRWLRRGHLPKKSSGWTAIGSRAW